jgi:Na+-translocating ferredoxin:NAD+ oxidoreductase RnfD subunit
MEDKISVSCSELKIPFHQLKELAAAGKIKLGIDNSVALQISSNRSLQPTNKAVTGALHLWNWVAVIVFIASIYLSFTSAWWWFIPGIFLSGIIANSNKKGNAENVLDEGLRDQIFYNKILSANGWIYQISKSDIQMIRDLIQK